MVPTITFPEITAASSIATQTYGPTIQALIDAISGAVVELVNFPTNQTQCRFYAFSETITQIGQGTGNCCKAFGWWIEMTITGSTLGYQIHDVGLYVLSTTIEGPVAVGDPITCPQGASTPWQVAGMSVTAKGDCCGKDADGNALILSFDAVDTDYFAEGFTATLGGVAPECAPCNRAEMPACVTLDAGDFHAYLSGVGIQIPALAYSGLVGGVQPGTSDMYKRDGDPDWIYLDATKRYTFGVVRIQNNNNCGNLGNPAGANRCCWSLQVASVEVQEDSGSGFVTIFSMGSNASFVIDGGYHSTLAGTYLNAFGSGPPGAPTSVNVTEGCP